MKRWAGESTKAGYRQARTWIVVFLQKEEEEEKLFAGGINKRQLNSWKLYILVDFLQSCNSLPHW